MIEGSGSTPKDLTPQEYVAMRSKISDTIGELLGWGGGGSTSGTLFDNIPSADALSPAMSGAETRALSNIDRQANELGPFGALQQDQVTKTLRGDFLGPDSNPFLQATIDAASRPINQAFEEEGLERRALFSRAGQSLPESSPFARAQSISNRGQADALGDVAAQIAGQNYQAERTRQQGAVDQASALDQVKFDHQVRNLEQQALPRLIAQYGTEKGVEIFNQRLAMLAQVLGIGGQLTTPTIGNDSYSFGIV